MLRCSRQLTALGMPGGYQRAGAAEPRAGRRCRALAWRSCGVPTLVVLLSLAGLPPPGWLHTDLDVLATSELAAVDYPSRAA
jgi:hypothetical protein